MDLPPHRIGDDVDPLLPPHAGRAPLLRAVPEARTLAAASPLAGKGTDIYRLAALQTAVAMFLVDVDGRVVAANPATEALLGRSEDDLLGLTVVDLSPPDDAEETRERLAAALREDVDSYRIEKRYLRADGSEVIADLTVSLIRDDDDEPIGFLATAVDETFRRAATEQAEAANRLLRATVDSFLDPWVYLVAVRGDDGVISDFTYADANPAACRHNRIAREDLVGRRLLELLPDHAGKILGQFADVVDTGVPLVEDDLPFSTHGEVRYFSNRGAAVGRDGLSITWRDTTEQVRLRAELSKRAMTDPMTGLLNRAGLDDAAARLAHDDHRKARGIAVLYVDLDGLGQINRDHGHPVGDAVLASVADRLAGAVRAGDLVARVGGDEFVAVAPGADDDGARNLAVKLAQAVTRPVPVGGGHAVVPTISVGITVGTTPSELRALIERADAAMLARKRALYADGDRYTQPALPDSD